MAPSATSTITEYASNNCDEGSIKIKPGKEHGEEYGKALVKANLKERAEGIDTETCDAGDEDAFFVADMGEIYRQHLRWKLNLKRVKPHFGKSSPSHA